MTVEAVKLPLMMMTPTLEGIVMVGVSISPLAMIEPLG